jgi:hypothetical protein
MTWVEDHVAASSLAYKDTNGSLPEDKVQLNEGWVHYKTIDHPNGMRYKIWVSPKNGNVMVAFRGTASLKEAKIDATLGTTTFKNARGEDIGHMYKGFGDAWNQLKSQLQNELDYLRRTSFIKDGSVLQFTGHSLGGAMTDIASTYFGDYFEQVQVVATTLGAPTSGDQTFVDYALNQSNVKRTRIISPGDPVANVKLPGMSYMNTPYVMDVGMGQGSTKRIKMGFYDMYKQLSDGHPGLAILNTLYGAGQEGIGQHSLENYANKLAEDFKAENVQSVGDGETQLRQDQRLYQQMRESDLPAPHGACSCDCHAHDYAIAQGLPPPSSSFGALPTSAPAVDALGTMDYLEGNGKGYDAQGERRYETDMERRNANLQQSLNDITHADNQKVMHLFNEALDRQQAKEEHELNKLEERYSILTNQDLANADPVTKNREAWERETKDLEHYDERIALELDDPELVPNDDPMDETSPATAREGAIKFKNAMSQLFTSIFSRQSYETAKRLDVDQADRDKAELGEIDEGQMVTDQTEHQIPLAAEADILDEEHQTGEYVLNYKLLGDVMNLTDDAKKQIDEWLDYPGMTPRKLYDSLRDQMKEDYKTFRRQALISKDNELKMTSVDDLKEKIMQFQGDLRLKAQQRGGFMNMISGSKDFKKLVLSGMVNVDRVISDYAGKATESEFLDKIMGYDPRTHMQLIAKDFETALLDIERMGLSPVERKAAIEKLHEKRSVSERFPWMDKDELDKFFEEHPEEGPERDAKLQEMADEKRYGRAYMEGIGYNIETNLNEDANYLLEHSEKLDDGTYTDGFQEMREKLDKEYSDIGKLEELFKEWNPDEEKMQNKELSDLVVNSLMGGIAGIPAAVDRYNSLKQTGWFTKDGKRLGTNASPDFLRYVREHPELGIEFKSKGTNPYMQKAGNINNGIAQLVTGNMFGIPMGPQDVADAVSGMLGFGGTSREATLGVLDGYLGSIGREDGQGVLNNIGDMGFLGKLLDGDASELTMMMAMKAAQNIPLIRKKMQKKKAGATAGDDDGMPVAEAIEVDDGPSGIKGGTKKNFNNFVNTQGGRPQAKGGTATAVSYNGDAQYSDVITDTYANKNKLQRDFNDMRAQYGSQGTQKPSFKSVVEQTMRKKQEERNIQENFGNVGGETSGRKQQIASVRESKANMNPFAGFLPPPSRGFRMPLPNFKPLNFDRFNKLRQQARTKGQEWMDDLDHFVKNRPRGSDGIVPPLMETQSMTDSYNSDGLLKLRMGGGGDDNMSLGSLGSYGSSRYGPARSQVSMPDSRYYFSARDNASVGSLGTLGTYGTARTGATPFGSVAASTQYGSAYSRPNSYYDGWDDMSTIETYFDDELF